MNQKSNMHVDGESDGRTVPTKCPNKSGKPLAEGMEGRRPTKENIEQTTASQTQSWVNASSGLLGVREAAKQEGKTRFTALLHHVTVALLLDSFYALKRDAAPGVDGVTWKEYETDLDKRLEDLHSRVHQGTYRAQPSKRAYIPKADGRRPLGIAALEDKIVQYAVVTVLNQIYEEDFLGFSYGFRPGRSQHQALDALWVGLIRKKVNWVLDADIRDFFGSISHEWLGKFIEHRIADRRILRLIRKWLRAGVSEEGGWAKTEVGTLQGAVVTPRTQKITSVLSAYWGTGRCSKRYLCRVTYGCVVVTYGSCQRSPKSRAPQPCTQIAAAFQPSTGCRRADGKGLRSLSSSSLSLSPASPAPEATGSYRRCQNRFYRQTFPKVGSASSRFREQHRFVVERDRQSSATGGIAAATRAWLSAPSSTATLFTLNIALIVCSPRKSRKPTNFSFPKYAARLDRRN